MFEQKPEPIEFKKVPVGYTKVFEKNRACTKFVIINVGGARSSKSYSIAQLMIEKLVTETGKKIGICRKTFPALRMTTMALVFDLLKEYGLYNEAWHNKTFNTYSYNGNTIQFFGLDESEKIKSAEFNYIWMEEGNEFTYEDYINLKLRLSGKCKLGEMNHLYISLNPIDSQNWIPIKAAKEQDVEVIHSTFNDNSYLSPAYIKALTDLMYQDENFYRVYALGEWGQLEGKIYSNYTVIPELPDMTGAKWAYGLDFGLVNPTAIAKVYLLGGKFYVEERLYKPGLTNADIIEFLTHEAKGDIYCDPSAKQMTAEIRQAGFAAYEGHKGVKDGIDLCQRQTLYVPQSSTNGIKELQGYCWRKDPNDPTHFLSEPVKYNDHFCVSGDSRVSTTHGDFPIKDLVGTQGLVYCYDEVSGKIVASKYKNVHQTGIKNTIRLNLSGGASLTLTEEHPVLLRNGSWKEAKDIVVSDSLMPFYRYIDAHGHLRINLNNGKTDFAHRVVWESFRTKIQDTWTYNLHHKDEDKLNNDLDNLELLTRAEHCRKHFKQHIMSSTGKVKLRQSLLKHLLQKEYRDKALRHLADIRPLTKIWHKSPEGHAWHLQHGMGKRQATIPKVCPVCAKTFRAKTERAVYCHLNCKAKALRQRRREQHNHTVLSIIPAGIQAVYNMEVEKTHNFVCGGVVVHNCDSFRYAVFGLTERWGFATRRPMETKPIQTLHFNNRPSDMIEKMLGIKR